MDLKLIPIICLLWAGMVAGISFLESWVKFRAPTLTKTIGVDVGRTVFKFFQYIQCFLIVALLATSIFTLFVCKCPIICH